MSETQSTKYRDVLGFPGYRVGDDGSVWSCRPTSGRGPLANTWRRLKPWANPCGYLRVDLFRHGQQRRVKPLVHRLILCAFVGPCPPGLQCCHRDGNPANNHLANLRWDTAKANIADRAAHGHTVHGASHPRSKLTADAVRQIRADRAAGRSGGWLGREYGVSKETIFALLRGQTWKRVV